MRYLLFILLLCACVHHKFLSSAKVTYGPPPEEARKEIEAREIIIHPVTDEFMSKENLDKFASENCDKVGAKCNDLMWHAFIAKLETEYPLADGRYVKRWCDMNPKACGKFGKLETEIIRSQLLVENRQKEENDNLALEKRETAERQNTLAEEISRQRRWQTWGAIANSIDNAQTNQRINNLENQNAYQRQQIQQIDNRTYNGPARINNPGWR